MIALRSIHRAFQAAVVASDEQITALPTSMVTGTALSQRLMPVFFVFMVPRLVCVVRLRCRRRSHARQRLLRDDFRDAG